MEIKLDPASFGPAIMAALQPEARDAILAEAVRTLVTPRQPKHSYEKPEPSPLQAAFERSLDYVASETARTILSEREDVKQMLDALITDACKRALTGEAGERITALIAAAVGAALRKAANY